MNIPADLGETRLDTMYVVFQLLVNLNETNPIVELHIDMYIHTHRN